MGIFTDYLTVASRKRLSPSLKAQKSEKQNDQEPDIDKSDENISTMTSVTSLTTVGEEPPNGGIAPGKAVIRMVPMNVGYDNVPNGGVPVDVDANQQPSTVQERALIPGSSNVTYHVTFNNYHSQPPAGDAAAASYEVDQVANNATGVTHSWLRLLRYGSRPHEAYPDPYREDLPGWNWIVPRSTSMKTFLAACLQRMGYPAREEFGVQVVRPENNGSWRGGEIFQWNQGEASLQIGTSCLGQGVKDGEVYICLWKK